MKHDDDFDLNLRTVGSGALFRVVDDNAGGQVSQISLFLKPLAFELLLKTDTSVALSLFEIKVAATTFPIALPY